MMCNTSCLFTRCSISSLIPCLTTCLPISLLCALTICALARHIKLSDSLYHLAALLASWPTIPQRTWPPYQYFLQRGGGKLSFAQPIFPSRGGNKVYSLSFSCWGFYPTSFGNSSLAKPLFCFLGRKMAGLHDFYSASCPFWVEFKVFEGRFCNLLYLKRSPEIAQGLEFRSFTMHLLACEDRLGDIRATMHVWIA